MNYFTTTQALFRNLQAILVSNLGLQSSNVFLTSSERFMEYPPGDFYIEIVMGTREEKEAQVSLGIATVSFSLCLFIRLLMDQAERDTQKITDETNGILTRLDSIDKIIINNSLNNSLLIPILPQSTEAPVVDPDSSGWVMIRRNYTCTIQYLFV